MDHILYLTWEMIKTAIPILSSVMQMMTAVTE